MEAGNHQNAVSFNLIEEAVREAPYSRPPPLPVDNRKAQWKLCNDSDGVFDCLNEPLCERDADVGIPLFGVVEFRFRFVRPYDSQAHRLGSPALTCSHVVPEGGFFS